MKINFKLLLSSVFISHLAGIIGSIATASSVSTWYTTLNKPTFNPPGWLFGPVWLLLYTMMGIALYLVWTSKLKQKQLAVKIFLVHLVFNTAWSLIFFGLKNLFVALIVIGVLWLMIAYLIFLFNKISKLAGWLLIPYLLWVSFASILNLTIWQLN